MNLANNHSLVLTHRLLSLVFAGVLWALARDDWPHEPKLDGYRLQVAKHGRTVRLYSRRDHEWSRRLAALAEALRGIPAYSTVVDAELCFPGPDGAPNFFRLLKAAIHGQGRELTVYVPLIC